MTLSLSFPSSSQALYKLSLNSRVIYFYYIDNLMVFNKFWTFEVHQLPFDGKQKLINEVLDIITHLLFVCRHSMVRAMDSRSPRWRHDFYPQTLIHLGNHRGRPRHQCTPNSDHNMLRRRQHEIWVYMGLPALASGNDISLQCGEEMEMSEIINWNLDTKVMAIMIKATPPGR